MVGPDNSHPSRMRRCYPGWVTAPSPDTQSYVHPDEARMAAFRRVYDNYLVVEDIYPGLAHRFRQARVRRFAELGGGRGPISAILAGEGVATCVVHLDDQMIAQAHHPALKADIRRLDTPTAGYGWPRAP